MFIIHVIPLSRGISKESLSYFTSTELAAGSIVTVPLRNRSIRAIVIFAEPALDLKSSIKNAPYPIKKIELANADPLFRPEFIRAAEKAARHFVGSTGSVLHSLVPKNVFDQSEFLTVDTLHAPLAPVSSPEQFVIQAQDEERYAHYKSIVREEFAKKASVFFCLPTIQEVEKVLEKLEKGIKEYTFVFHGKLSKKRMVTLWNKLMQEEHPVLIVSTGAFFALPRNDISTIIIDKESSGAYKTLSRPFVDIRTFAELYAKEIKARLIFGDFLLRVETIWRHRRGDFIELMPLTFRALTTTTQEVIDLRAALKNESGAAFREPQKRHPFTIISSAAKELIAKSKHNNEHIFLFTARRGLAPMTICGDCETVILCDRCSAPTVLHKAKGENFFLCHKCGHRKATEMLCPHCGSWKLTPLGIGIERVEETVRAAFPESKVFRIDSDSTKTHEAASEIAGQFFAAPGSILIGTEMALSYLSQRVDNSIIVSIDSLFSLPDFRINEKILSILLTVRSATTKHFIIQSRSADEPVVEHALRGNIIDFCREELDLRKQFSYPPFSTLVKISSEGKKAQVLEEMHWLEERLAPFSPQVFPAFIATVSGNYLMHCLIKVPEWPNEKLLKLLNALPPHFTIKVDPESLL